jgi:thiazole/oxazole-forming peptide maturase SagD family component
MAALAEALERYLWFTQEDYFVHPIQATEKEIARTGAYVPLAAWAGFSEEQRKGDPARTLRPDARYLWIKARSLISGKLVYVPAQLMSGKRSRENQQHREPLIRYANTNGLATWPTKVGAHIAGIAELIERESYMVVWLNQLTLPRIDLTARAINDPLLTRALADCKRYRLKVHAVRMVTDAPIHPVYVILEDESTLAPRFTIGLNAHRSLNRAVLKAITEALRARRGYRIYFAAGNTYDLNTPVDKIGHRDRLYYWGNHAENLEFLIRGPVVTLPESPWERETDDAYFVRLMQWCTSEHLDCLAISLGDSKKNPTPLHIEMVAIPQLAPTYLREPERAFGSERLRSLAIKCGYAPRAQPFIDHPHPFS